MSSDLYMDEDVEVHEVLVNVSSKGSNLFEVERWGTLVKAIRVVARVLRFIRFARVPSSRQSSDLTLKELEQAKVVLTKSVQRQSFPEEMAALERGASISRKSRLFKLSPYCDEEGMMRVKGRLDFAQLTYDEKHPIIVPKSHFAVLLITSVHTC